MRTASLTPSHRYGWAATIKWRQMRSNGVDEVCDRRQHGQGEVPGLGRDHAKAHRQPAVPLEPPGAEEVLPDTRAI